MVASRLCFHENSLPEIKTQNCVLIFDKNLEKLFSSWIHKFPYRYRVTGGEALKDFSCFAAHATDLAKVCGKIGPRELRIVAFGGGSIGDFAGFFASMYKRGVTLIHVPSTWLAALDSAHGGKTALNLGGVKNQVGSFYPATQVHLVRKVLETNSSEREIEAFAEALKVGLLQGPELFKRIERTGSDQLWKVLRPCIRAKMRIVKQDPLERSGRRHILNLGHTIGHVLEAEQGLSHGKSVALGLVFALEWSKHLGLLKKEIGSRHLPKFELLQAHLRGLSQVKKYLEQDKKRTKGARIRFVYLAGPGHPVIRAVSVGEILTEVKRQQDL